MMMGLCILFYSSSRMSFLSNSVLGLVAGDGDRICDVVYTRVPLLNLLFLLYKSRHGMYTLNSAHAKLKIIQSRTRGHA